VTPVIEITIDSEFKGPSILELQSSIPHIEAGIVIDVKWSNTKPEFYLLQKLKHSHKFCLHVVDLQAMERAASFLGQTLKLDTSIIEKGKRSLNSTGWRDYASELGTAVARSVMTKIAADNVRRGNRVNFISVARDTLLDGINPVDADVLFRLRNTK